MNLGQNYDTASNTHQNPNFILAHAPTHFEA